MKILYFLNGTTLAGGATKSFLALIEEVRKNGHDLGVVCPDEKGIYQLLKNEKIWTVSYEFRPFAIKNKTLGDKLKFIPHYLYYSYLNHKAFNKLNKDIKEFNPDLIHENSSVIDLGYRFSKRLHIPYIMHVREYGDKDFNTTIIGINKRLKDKNTNSIFITKDLQAYRKQSSNPNSIQIYNGIIDEKEIRYNKDKKRFFLYAGRIEPAKGVKELIKSYVDYSLSIDDPIPIKLAGLMMSENYIQEIKQLIAEHNLENKVEWLGEIKNIKELMSEAVATIIPSLNEGLGRVMPEAIANGSLCIARNSAGLKEQMDTGKNFLGNDIALSFNSSEELTQLLKTVTFKFEQEASFQQEGEYFKIIKDGTEFVKTFFSKESSGRKIIEFYNKIYNRQ